MAQHRMPRKYGTRKALAIGIAAAGLSSALVFGQTADTTVHPDVALANAVIGIGGRDDGTSKRLQDKLTGNYALGFSGEYMPITYPANILFQSSVDDAAPKLATAIGNADGDIRISSYSEGTLVAERIKRGLAAGTVVAPAGSTVDFVFIASPYSPNGGLFARFPGFRIPGLLPVFGPAQPTGYDSTYVTNEYDGYADFPAYFNPLSMANAFMGMIYAHPDQYYDGIKLDQLVEGKTKFTTKGDNGAGGHDTYILVYNPHLPLLAPLRQIAALTRLTPLTEPVLGAIEPLLRLVVDMGYTDRINANPAQPTPFSLVTPPKKVLEALTGVPGALQQGVTGTPSGGQPANVPNPGVADVQRTPTPSPVDSGASSIEEKKPPTEANGANGADGADDEKRVTPAPAKKPAADPFKSLAKALKSFGLHPTKKSDGNKVSPTTTAGDASTTGPKSTPATTTGGTAAPAADPGEKTDATAGEKAAA